MPTMTRKAKKTIATGGRSSGGTSLQALDLAVPFMGQDQAAEPGDADLVVVGRRCLVGERRTASMCMPRVVSQAPSIAATFIGW